MSEDWVLLVDPSKNLLNAYRMVFEGQYPVETALSLGEARLRFSTRRYATIITEYFVPFKEMSRLIHWVKRNSPETCIIMVTSANLDDITYRRLFQSGLDDLLLKPYSPDKILAHVEKGLRQRELFLRKLELEEALPFDPAAQPIRATIFSALSLTKCLHQELKRAKRHQHSLSLLLIHIRERERLAERVDDLSIELAKVLRKNLREEDSVGKENSGVAVVLPETDQAGARAVVERLYRLIKNHTPFQSKEGTGFIPRSLSIESFTYPHLFKVPEPFREIIEDVEKEFLR